MPIQENQAMLSLETQLDLEDSKGFPGLSRICFESAPGSQKTSKGKHPGSIVM